MNVAPDSIEASNQGLKIAVTAWADTGGWQAEPLCRQAEEAEAIGFHSIWLPENHFGDIRSIPSPLTLLAAIAARTKTIKLGSTSYLLPIRNALQAAAEVAVLDQLSNGRVILGVGRGVQDAMFKAFELPTKDKRQRFKSNLDTMINAWEGNPILADDEEPIFLAPLPVQKPYPPIWVAAFGPLALKQAGNLGMPYLASPVETLETLVANYQHHQQVALDAGHSHIDTIPIMRTAFVTDNQSLANDVKEALAGGPGHNMRDAEASIDEWTIIGDQYYVKDKVQQYVEKLSMTHLIVRGRMPQVSDKDQLASHEALLRLAG